MKKIISVILSAAMLTTGLTACAAENGTEQKTESISISMQIDNPIMTVNGAETEIDEGRGTTPVIVNERTLVPIRAIIEAMGGTVSWDQSTQTATLDYDKDEIRLIIDSATAYLNDEPNTLDTTPTIINERTMLPIRFIAESFGFDVDWDDSTRTVTIEKTISVSDEIAAENIIRFSWNDNEILVKLNDGNASKDLLSRLPMTIEFEDYNSTEKVAYLDEKLDDSGSDDTYDPNIGDLTSYLPWGTLSLFYKDFTSSSDLISLGKVISGDELMNEMEGSVRIELADTKGITAMNDNMVLIKGGTFTMGSPASEYERDNDEVQHEVTVSDFYMSPTEVSQKEYQSLMGNNPSENKGDNLPVENITWYDAIAYCNALSKSEGLTEVYIVDGNTVTWNKSANGYRLPTEAEWEYAARANAITSFNFGDYVHNSDANCYNAYGYNNDASGNWVNGSDSYLRKTVEVTRYNTNDYGLYNMHGNVAEWVWDWYDAYDTEATDNPTGKDSGNAKVIRGGGWNDHPKHIRSAYRGAHPADVPLYSIGFRVVRSAETGAGSLTSTLTKVNEKENKNVLIAYFSQTGNTEGLTDIIADMTGADVFHIERKTPYASSSNGPVLYGEALNELREYAVPDLKTSLEEAGYNIDDYDTILLGYCNWWSSIPAPVRSFLIKYDMSGKTIIPYCSMGGGRFGQTISAIAKLNPNSTIKEGLDVSYSSYNSDRIQQWLIDSGIKKKG
ncbi:MAG: SUMF1/EgtB/PvdO family nonheme iron enzyme [Clostridia bacterium]|nr:SUMF1/EgtB/PvdO family nonheme iron enzyme [Clostridia bacterium]